MSDQAIDEPQKPRNWHLSTDALEQEGVVVANETVRGMPTPQPNAGSQRFEIQDLSTWTLDALRVERFEKQQA